MTDRRRASSTGLVTARAAQRERFERRQLTVGSDHVIVSDLHTATEGPLGLAARGYCTKRRLFFTTAYHTKFPEYFRARFGIPLPWSYSALRHFHARSSAVMVATETVRCELAARGFERVVTWTRGVDTECFRPSCAPAVDLPRPVFLSVGRVAAEKNLPYFLDLELPGSNLVVGDGHLLPEMKRRYPAVHF